MILAVATTKAFDAMVVVHVLVAAGALTVLVVLVAAAAAVERGGPLPLSAQRTFAQPRELAGRAVHLVPLTGLVVVGLSRGAYSLSTGFVATGLALWAAAAVALEGVGFPAQRRVAAALAARADAAGAARRLRLAGELAALAIVAATVVMVLGGR